MTRDKEGASTAPTHLLPEDKTGPPHQLPTDEDEKQAGNELCQAI